MQYDRTMAWSYGSEKDIAFIKKIKTAYTSHNILPHITSRYPSTQKIKVLEFGPGLGIMTELFIDNYNEIDYTAIDIDKTVLERVSKILPSAHTICAGDFESFSQQVKNNKYDIIVALDVWEHLPNKELIDYTRKAYEILNPSGCFIAQVPNLASPMAFNCIYASDITHQNMFNENSAKQLLLMAEIPVEKIKIIPYEFPPINIFWKVRTFFRKLFYIFVKMQMVLLGVVRNDILTPNLIMVAEK